MELCSSPLQSNFVLPPKKPTKNIVPVSKATLMTMSIDSAICSAPGSRSGSMSPVSQALSQSMMRYDSLLGTPSSTFGVSPMGSGSLIKSLTNTDNHVPGQPTVFKVPMECEANCIPSDDNTPSPSEDNKCHPCVHCQKTMANLKSCQNNGGLLYFPMQREEKATKESGIQCEFSSKNSHKKRHSLDLTH